MSCFSSPVGAQALVFFDDTGEHGFEEPTVPDHLLREVSLALDALLLAVETRDEAAVLIIDCEPSSSSPSSSSERPAVFTNEIAKQYKIHCTADCG